MVFLLGACQQKQCFLELAADSGKRTQEELGGFEDSEEDWVEGMQDVASRGVFTVGRELRRWFLS